MVGETTARLDEWRDRLRIGDESALNELIAHFQGRLEGLAHKMLTSFPVVRAKEQTQDVLQEALLHFPVAFRALVASDDGPAGKQAFHGADLFRFVATLIRRELIDLARRYRHQLEGLPPDDLLNRGNTWNPQALAEWTEFHEVAGSLDPDVRDVFDRIFYCGRTQPEAAAELGVSERTVRSRWQDARLRLMSAFKGRMPGS